MRANTSFKSYSFIWDFSEGTFGSINTGLFIPQNTVIVAGGAFKIIDPNIGILPQFAIGWAGNTSGLSDGTTFVPGGQAAQYSQTLTTQTATIPAGGIQVLLTISFANTIAGRIIFLMSGWEMLE